MNTRLCYSCILVYNKYFISILGSMYRLQGCLSTPYPDLHYICFENKTCLQHLLHLPNVISCHYIWYKQTSPRIMLQSVNDVFTFKKNMFVTWIDRVQKTWPFEVPGHIFSWRIRIWNIDSSLRVMMHVMYIDVLLCLVYFYIN